MTSTTPQVRAERRTDLHTDLPADPADPAEHRLSAVLPAVVSVVLLFGLLMAGAFLLKEVAGLGLWLVGGF